MNIWDFNDDEAKTVNINKDLTNLLAYIKKMPSGDMRLIMEVSTAQLAVSMGTMTRVDAIMKSLKGLVAEEKEEPDANPSN